MVASAQIKLAPPNIEDQGTLGYIECEDAAEIL